METVCDSCKLCCLHSFGAGLDNLVLSCVLCFFWLSVLLDWLLALIIANFLQSLSLRRRSLPMTSPGIFCGCFLGGGDAGCGRNTDILRQRQLFRAGFFGFLSTFVGTSHCGGKRSLWWFAFRWSCFVKGSDGPKSCRDRNKKKQHNLHTLLRKLVPQMGCFYGVYTLMIEIHLLWWGTFIYACHHGTPCLQNVYASMGHSSTSMADMVIDDFMLFLSLDLACAPQ